MNWQNKVLGATLAVMMAACGGGGSGSDSSAFGSTSGNAAFGNGSSNSSNTTTTNPDVQSNASGAVLLSLSNSTASSSQPATVTAVVKDAAGIPVAGALIRFELTGGTDATSLANLSPASAITDTNGQAVTTLTPRSGSTSGAAYVNASADTSAGTLTAKKAFTVSATDVTLSSVTIPSGYTINGYETTLVSIAVLGASSSNPVTVNVTSTCATNGKAAISPATLTLTGNSGSVTYQDKGCGTTGGSGSTSDRISVQIVGTTQQGYKDLTVLAPITQGIQFVSVDAPTICQKGTGCTSVANVTFKVVDQAGGALAGKSVDFSLDNNVATVDTNVATLGASSGVTGADGTITVSVAAKNVTSPVRVSAKVHGTSLQTVSNTLTISGGLPVAANSDAHNGISLASTKYAMDYYLIGDYADVTLRLTDRYGAPAVDGTVVNLVSDGGTVMPAYCVTKDGTGECTTKLVVSNPRPTSGRVHVVAYANAQEYFVDANRNGTYDVGEDYASYAPPAAVCLDVNENRTCQSQEFLVGDVSHLNSDNGQWDGAGSAFARTDAVFAFSDSRSTPRLFKVDGDGECTTDVVDDTYMTVSMAGKALDDHLKFCVADGNANADPYGGNPLPAGVSITLTANIINAAVSVDNSPTPAIAFGPTVHTVTVQNTSSGSPQTPLGTGQATITIKMAGRTLNMTQKVNIGP